jgi:hypothetical protein
VSRSGDHPIDVELLEDDLDVPGAAPARGRRRVAARVPRRAWWAAVGCGLAVVAGVAVTEQRAEAALDARLARTEGLATSLADPLGEAWRVPGVDLLGTAGESLLVLAEGGGIRAVDPGTGTVRWTRDGSCRVVPIDDAGGDAPSAPRPGRPDDLVLCVDELRTGGLDGGHVRPLTAHVLDPADGAVLHSIDLGAPGSWSTVGPDLVSLGIADDGHARAARWSLLTGERRWTYRSPDVLPPNDSWGSSIGGAVVQLDIGNWTLTLDAETGVRIPRVPFGSRTDTAWGPLAMADGARATSRIDATGSTETTVLEPDGSTRVAFPGILLLPSVDDGSAPDRLFVVQGDDAATPQRVAGVDAVTGRTRWTSTARIGQAAVVRGLLLLRDETGLTALDARTGRVRWTTGGEASAGRGMVTDGRRVLTLDRATSGPALVARDVLTGAEAWTSRLAVEQGSLDLLPDGAVVADGREEVVALAR